MNIFSGKRYFNDILWAPAYNNNTLPDTGISSNKIYKYKEHSYGNVKAIAFYLIPKVASASI
jgi:hypothetical protein